MKVDVQRNQIVIEPETIQDSIFLVTQGFTTRGILERDGKLCPDEEWDPRCPNGSRSEFLPCLVIRTDSENRPESTLEETYDLMRQLKGFALAGYNASKLEHKHDILAIIYNRLKEALSPNPKESKDGSSQPVRPV